MTTKQESSPCRILVMASGFGSNFQALIDAVAQGRIPNSRITRLIVNRQNVHSTVRADEAGIPWDYFNLITHGFVGKGEKDKQKVAQARQEYDAALARKILSAADSERPQLIVLAGWMHVFSNAFLQPMEDAGVKVINLHPALPGQFDGAGAIERAYEALKAGEITHTGIMAHYVIQEVDRGTPILVQEIEWNQDSYDELKAKIHSHEHQLIVRATGMVVEQVLE